MPDCTSNGLSVMAVDDSAPDTVAGVLINRDFKLPLPDGVPDAFAWFLPIATALMNVDTVYETERPNLQVGDAVDLWMLGVDAERFGRRGIGGRLIQLATELARDRGFSRCVTECTGHYSQAAAERAGFTEITRLAYKDFRFDGRPVFDGVSAPHTHLALYERQF
jgi:ribosomal protein S18 acetylase RimI-like enzyme